MRARRCRRRASRGSTAPAEAPRAAALLLTLVARERLRDHEPLDLARALEQRVDLGVPVPLLDREVPDVSVAATDLDRLLGDFDCHLARLQLRHRALGPLELTAVAALPQRSPDERTRRLDLGGHVGEHERDRLVLDQRAAELLALRRSASTARRSSEPPTSAGVFPHARAPAWLRVFPFRPARFRAGSCSLRAAPQRCARRGCPSSFPSCPGAGPWCRAGPQSWPAHACRARARPQRPRRGHQRYRRW